MKRRNYGRSKRYKTNTKSNTQISSLVDELWPNIYEIMSLRLKSGKLGVEAVRLEAETHPRKDQAKLEPDEREQFINAFKTIIENGQFANLVSIHSDYRHRIHTANDINPNQRFLPWHRIFLHQLEVILNNANVKPSKIRIPYWDWTVNRDLPDIIKTFKPRIKDVPIIVDRRPQQPITEIRTIKVERYVGTWPDQITGRPLELPTKTQVDRLDSIPNFRDFTELLEAFHSRVHVWVGGTTRYPPVEEEDLGTMSNILISPSDPVFWLHHSNIDRLWDRWHKTHTGGPSLQGDDAVMDPWSYRTDRDRIEDTNIFGYTYE